MAWNRLDILCFFFILCLFPAAIRTTRSGRKVYRRCELVRSRQPRGAHTNVGDCRRRLCCLRRPHHALEPTAGHYLVDIIHVVSPVTGQPLLIDAACAKRGGAPDVKALVGTQALQFHEVFYLLIVIVEIGVDVTDAA